MTVARDERRPPSPVAQPRRYATSILLPRPAPAQGAEPGTLERTRRHRTLLLLGIALVDIALILLASELAWQARGILYGWWPDAFRGTGGRMSPHILGVVVPWVLMLAAAGAFRPRHLAPDLDEFRTLATTSLYALTGIGFVAFLADSDISRSFLLLTFAFGLPLLLLAHLLLRKHVHRSRARGGLGHRVLAVGAPGAIADLDTVLREQAYTGYRIVGACIPSELAVHAGDLDVPLLGSVRDVRQAALDAEVDTVMVAGGGLTSSTDLRRIGWELEGTDTRLVVTPSLVDVAGPRIQMRLVAGLPLVHVEEPQVGQAGGLLKRAFDLVGAGTILLLTLPVLVGAALAIKLGDRGPVLFRQERIGRHGERFGMLKLRTMVVDAEARLEAVAHLNESGGTLFKIRSDPRITRVGAFLRKYSIDELPQLWNVVRGDMSLVGPRPPLPCEVEKYEADVHRRLLVRPGMTGLWQVSGRSGLSWSESVRLDLYYVDNWSMVGDLGILLKTVRAVLRPDGAY